MMMILITDYLSAPERSEGAEVFKKHVRDADDHVGAKCEIRTRRGLSTAPSVCLSVRLLFSYLTFICVSAVFGLSNVSSLYPT